MKGIRPIRFVPVDPDESRVCNLLKSDKSVFNDLLPEDLFIHEFTDLKYLL
jgi:hypothetical protein